MENLIKRAKDIILQPKTTWEEIKNEQTSIQGILVSYILPLALIPAIASFIGFGLIGASVPFVGRMHSIEWGLNQAITSFVSMFLGVLISGWVISWLAPKFDTNLSFENGVKLVAYSYTPALVAGVFNVIPALAIIGLLAGIYSLYVLYLGFKPVTNVSDDKTTSYFVVSIVVIIAVYIVLGLILGVVLGTAGLTSFKY